MTKPIFDRNNKEFYTELKKRINAYFTENNISKSANGNMYLITFLILLGYFGCYFLLLSNTLPLPIFLLCSLLFGFFTAQIGINIAHDAIHGSFFAKKSKNQIFSTLFNIVGANDYVWKISHNFFHHTYTNIPHHDDDINQPSVLRLSNMTERKWYHRFQHIYVFFLYCLSSLSWVFIKDFVKFFNKDLRINKNEPHPKKEIFRLFFYKAVYYTMTLVIPFLVIDLPWYWILTGFLLMHMAEGMTLAIVFHLAHLVENTDFPEPDTNNQLENDWAIHQMYTTADFSRKSWWANVLCGGLNFQIEHHLFPNICHIHYKNLSPIVKQTAEEFDVPFIENETFTKAIGSHMNFLRKMGRA